MIHPTLDQQKAIVEQWKRAAPALADVRRRELAEWEYDWATVDALLDLGGSAGPSRSTSGLVEMQRVFMKAARERS